MNNQGTASFSQTLLAGSLPGLKLKEQEASRKIGKGAESNQISV